jgi:putative ATPase
MVICAAEDVGNASPMALVLANAALQVSEFVGLPEAKIPLAQAVTFIATAPKSNAAYLAIAEAEKDVREGRTLEVPKHLKGASFKGAKKLGRGVGYKYAHNFKDHWVAQEYTPVNKQYYKPTTQGYEAGIKKRLEACRKKRREKLSGQK